jgi:hypothetical protein
MHVCDIDRFKNSILIFTTESLEAARGMDEIRKSTPAGANKVSIPQYHGRVPSSSPNPCTPSIPNPRNGHFNK